MKHSLLILILPLLLFSISLHAQLENVIVETYYIADSLDVTNNVEPVYDDNTGEIVDSFRLGVGYATYRIYIDLKSGYKLKKIYGDASHTIKIASDSIFFNHPLNGQSFGNRINKNKFTENPTLALDSWLTLGNATSKHWGVLKTEDTDGSSIKLWPNADPAVGIPLNTADGLVPISAGAGSTEFLSSGILEPAMGTDSTIFGSLKAGREFASNNAYLQIKSSGIIGTTDNNRVLIAQLTTKGKISFELNMEVWMDDGTAYGKTINYVAKSNYPPHGDTLISPYLTYPYKEKCGCKDPNYLEYNKNLVCSIDDSCKTRIVFGCMDPLACNYDPHATYNISSLCCYPGFCQDRDIAIICPDLSGERNKPNFNLYPNPAQDQVTFKISNSSNNYNEIWYVIYDSFGKVMLEKNIGIVSGTFNEQVDVSSLHTGVYLLRLLTGEKSDSKMFMKR